MHLHFVQSTEPLEGGGLGRAAYELAVALNCVRGGGKLVTTGRVEDLGPVLVRYKRSGPTRLFFSNGMWRDADSLVQSAGVVHGHGFYVGPNWIIGRRAERLRKPFVYHPHGIFEPWILARSRWKKRVAHYLFEDANFRYAGLWRALTSKEADQIRRQGMTAPIIVCPNGIDLDSFSLVDRLRQENVKHRQKRTLLFLGRLHPKKGLDLLLHAWSRVSASLRGSWTIVVAGPDELNHRAEIEALIESLELGDDVVLVGAVVGEAKVRMFASADAFILPSRSEGFSVAILEAMACSLPVIATTACNFPELVQQGAGWECEPEIGSITRALSALLQADDNELSQRGAAGRHLVESCYGWATIAKTIDQACMSIFHF